MAMEWTVTLNTGTKAPAFGLGTFAWQSKPGEVAKVVDAALRAGYRSIDCAYAYGNEGEIGEALQKCFKEGVLKREELFITTKLWCTFHQREDVLSCCQESLKNLQLDYLDLYLVHTPIALKKEAKLPGYTQDDILGYDPDTVADTWKGMEDLVEKGLVRAIGVSNFTITKIERLLQTAKIVPAVNQVECHPYFQQPKLKEYCDWKGIVLEAYSPLGSPARPVIAAADPVVMEDPVIKEMAAKYNATVGQICIAFALHRGLMVIPKTVNPARVVENLKSTELKLDAADMKRLIKVDKNLRLFRGEGFLPKGVTWEEAFDVEADEKFVIPK